MPALANNTARKSLKRRKDSNNLSNDESSHDPNEVDNNNNNIYDDDDDASPLHSPSSLASSLCSSNDDDDSVNLMEIDTDLVLKEENEILSRHRTRGPTSERGLNAESSAFETPFIRNTISECIKENSRSENDFMYLNNLYTFSAVKKTPSMASLAASLTSSSTLEASRSKIRKFDHSNKENAGKVKGLQRLRSNDEEIEYKMLLKEKKGFEIKYMIGDGNCLFRSVADQLYGDQEKHAQVRKDCMDYMERNREYFSQYVVEDFDDYLRRKRTDGVFGNHVEIQSIAELYNRRVEIYCYELTPLNIFQGEMALSDATPIRLSYHNGCHFNSVVDTTHPFVPLGPEMPESYKRPPENNINNFKSDILESVISHTEQNNIESQVVKSVEKESEQSNIESQVIKSVEKESEQNNIDSLMLESAQIESTVADTESQVIKSVEKESETKDLEAQMVKTAEAESEARNLEDEILRQVMMDSAKEVNGGDPFAQDDDAMLQFALQQSRMESLTGFLQSIQIPSFSNKPPPPPTKQQ